MAWREKMEIRNEGRRPKGVLPQDLLVGDAAQAGVPAPHCWGDSGTMRRGGIGDQETGGRVIHRLIFHNEEVKAVKKAPCSPRQGGLICGWWRLATGGLLL